ncbi:LamG-like jellyroll fold domain-containing protein [Arthrobacter sp. M-10]|uniref:hypothetical protein n=1 Tax=Arthrobacter sp. M-10 TaxID=3233037 RepID=UPI003F938AB5
MAVFSVLLGLLTSTGVSAVAASARAAEKSPASAPMRGPTEPVDPGTFVSLSPFRALDTRGSSAVGADAPVSFQVGGVSGIPANVSAVVFNLTVTGPKSFGFVSAFASGTERPNTSNVNFGVGQTVANSVTVPVGADGKVTLFNRSGGSTDLIADVSGYYLSGSPVVPGAFAPLAPSRMLDTRGGSAAGGDSPVSFQVGGVSGIPANVSAVVFNLTVTGPKSFGFVSAFASGTERPNASNVNFGPGQTVANSVTVPVGADGKVTLFNRSGGSTDLIADVSGYYLSGAPVVPGAFAPLAPSRMLDTRPGSAAGGDSPVSFQVGGVSGIPANVSAVVFNLTVTGPKSFGFVSAFASGTLRPNASNVNFGPGQTVANSVTVPVGADGKVTLFNRSSGATDLIADVSGYFMGQLMPPATPVITPPASITTIPGTNTGTVNGGGTVGEGKYDFTISEPGTYPAKGFAYAVTDAPGPTSMPVNLSCDTPRVHEFVVVCPAEGRKATVTVGPADRSTSLKVWAFDYVGNVSYPADYEFRVANTVPVPATVLPITAPSNGSWVPVAIQANGTPYATESCQGDASAGYSGSPTRNALQVNGLPDQFGTTASPAVNTAESFSVSGWFCPTNPAPGGNTIQSLIAQVSDTGDLAAAVRLNTDGQPELDTWTTGGTLNQVQILTGQTSNQWFFLTAVYDKVNQQLRMTVSSAGYSGTWTTAAATQTHLPSTTQPVRLGEGFKGQILNPVLTQGILTKDQFSWVQTQFGPGTQGILK